MPGAYQSNYGNRINEALDSMGAANNAGYDVARTANSTGSTARAQANARAAAENAAAGAAALSGGYGSSYANSVAQQGYQQAMANVDSGAGRAAGQGPDHDQLKQNGLSGLLSALQNQDSLEAAEHQGAVTTRRTGGTTRRARQIRAAQEKSDFPLEPVGDGEECGQSRSDGLRHLQGLTQQQWGERVCPGTVGSTTKSAPAQSDALNAYEQAFNPVPAGSGRCRERRSGPVWSGHRHFLTITAAHPSPAQTRRVRSRPQPGWQAAAATRLHGGAGTVRPGSKLCGELQDDRRTAACNGAGEKRAQGARAGLRAEGDSSTKGKRKQLDEQPTAKYGKDIFFYEGK